MSRDELDARIERGFDGLANASPARETLRGISRQVAGSVKPVRSLPSNAVLTMICLAGFAILAILFTIPVGYAGFQRLDPMRRLILYPAVLIAVAPLAVSLVSRMIPGSRMRVPLAIAVLFALIAIGGVTPLLFPAFGLERFVHDGVPCLRLGAICAVPAGVCAYMFLRWGWIANPVSTALSAGAISGCLGVAVLALHCPIQNTPHILTWHLGVVPLAIALAAIFTPLYRGTKTPG